MRLTIARACLTVGLGCVLVVAMALSRKHVPPGDDVSPVRALFGVWRPVWRVDQVAAPLAFILILPLLVAAVLVALA